MSDISSQRALDLLSETRVIVGKLQVHLEGNGGKGVLERQEDQETRLHGMENWKATRPLVCPATAPEVLKTITKGLSIATGVIVFIISLSVLANTLLMNRGERGLELEVQKQMQEQLKSLQEAIEKLTPD